MPNVGMSAQKYDGTGGMPNMCRVSEEQACQIWASVWWRTQKVKSARVPWNSPETLGQQNEKKKKNVNKRRRATKNSQMIQGLLCVVAYNGLRSGFTCNIS